MSSPTPTPAPANSYLGKPGLWGITYTSKMKETDIVGDGIGYNQDFTDNTIESGLVGFPIPMVEAVAGFDWTSIANQQRYKYRYTASNPTFGDGIYANYPCDRLLIEKNLNRDLKNDSYHVSGLSWDGIQATDVIVTWVIYFPGSVQVAYLLTSAVVQRMQSGWTILSRYANGKPRTWEPNFTYKNVMPGFTLVNPGDGGGGDDSDSIDCEEKGKRCRMNCKPLNAQLKQTLPILSQILSQANLPNFK